MAVIPTFNTFTVVVFTQPLISLKVITELPPATSVIVAKELLLVFEVAAIVATLVVPEVQGVVAKGAAFAVIVKVDTGVVVTPHK